MISALIPALGTVFAGVLAALVGYFVKRTDRVAKATRANMADQQYTMHLVSTIRDDYWTLSDWAYHARQRYADVLARCKEIAVSEAFETLPAMPRPQHRELEVRHARGENTEKDDD